MSFYSSAITLFLVMDPLGNVPVFLSVLARVNPQRRQLIIFRESCIALLVLTLFLFFGQSILHGLQISEAALRVAGGIILFLIALKMIFPVTEPQKDQLTGEPFIVPLAIPMIAGPSSIATVLLFSSEDIPHLFQWLVALILVSTLSTIILLFAEQLRRILGHRGLLAVERLMGMVLTTLSVQMFLQGIVEYLKATQMM